MPRLLSRFASLLALSSIAACGTASQYMPTAQPPHPVQERDAETVDVFTDGAVPSRPYVEIGLIEGHRRTHFSGAETLDIYSVMRDRAADHGCDAMIITRSDDRRIRTISGEHDTLAGFFASCVVYLPTPPAPPVAPVTPVAPVAAPVAAK